MPTFGTVRKIARAAQAGRCVVMRNHASAIASTFDTIAWVIYWSCLAHPLLHCVSFVADAERPRSAKRTTPIVAAVDIRACISAGNAVVLNSIEALVAYTQGLIGAGDHARTVVVAVNAIAW